MPDPCPLCPGKLRQAPYVGVLECSECRVAFGAEKPHRIGCIVPYCRKTRGDRKNSKLVPFMEWLCGDHWELVPSRLKQRRAKFRRMKKRTGDPARLARIDEADREAWEACKKAAIERAAGI